MHGLMRFFRRLANVVRPRRRDPDLEREIAAHLTLLEDEYHRRGLSVDEAHRQARATLGGVERTKELHRGARSFRPVDDAVRDVRYAVRLLRRAPIFSLTAILSLAIAIGATTTVFTAVDALLVRTAPGIADPDRVVDITRMSAAVGVDTISADQYRAIRERVTGVQDVFGYGLSLTPMSWIGGSADAARPVFTDIVTPNFFAGLGVTAAVGRVFTESDGGSVVVLSYRFWKQQFQSDPAVVGSLMRLGDTVCTVVGVARPEFHGNTILAPDLWIPSDVNRPLRAALVGGRLQPGVTLTQARAEMETIAHGLSTDPAMGRQWGPFATLRVDRSTPVPYGVRILVAGFFALLMAIVVVVLIVACANVAGLLLARGAGRARETAVRVALGVSRARLVRQLLTETLVLFVAGGLGGLLLSRVMAAAILRILPSLPLPNDPALVLDSRVVIFALGLSCAAAVTFGLAPAVRTTRIDVLTLLKTEEQGSASAVRLRRAFVVAQVALSVVLVIVGTLLARTLGRGAAVNGTFDGHGVDVVALDLATAGYTPTTGRLFIADLGRKLGAMPDLQAAGIGAETPTGGALGFRIDVPGLTAGDRGRMLDVLGDAVAPGYFATLRIPLLAGRDFAGTDTDSAARAVIVTEKTVHSLWPALPPQQAIGREISLHSNLADPGDPHRAPARIPMTIVGIVADARRGAMWRPYIYLPIQQQYSAAIKILVRARGDRRAVSLVREQLLAMDRRLPVLKTNRLDDEANPVTLQLQISAAIAGTLGIVGVLLAAIGVYGVTAYMVARRTREIGIRVALGADRRAVVRMAMGEAARLLAVGAAAGLLLGAGAARVLRGLQFGVVAADPLPFVGALALFLLVGLAASWMPVRRALAIDPSRALRYE